MKTKYTDAQDKLAALVEEAKYFLTDSDIEMLKPNSEVAGAGAVSAVDHAIKSLEGILHCPEVRNHPFSPSRLDALGRQRMDLTLLRVLSNPDYFAFCCYHLFCMNEGEPLRLVPFQSVTMWELWWRKFPMLIYTRGGSKSTSLAIYILLRLLFTPGAKIAVVAKSLRQSMIIWETCSRIWYNSPLLRDLVGKGGGLAENGPRRGGNDRCEFRIGESVALFLPLGATGDTIRGIRAQYVICDEAASVSEDVYAVVVQGFGAVASDPATKMASRSREKILKRLGLWSGDMDELEAESRRGNQSIMAGTASYQFNHFYKYWKNYHDIIMTRGNPDKIAEVLGGPPTKSFDWRDYSIIRLPWDAIPHGYMDENTVIRAKQISSQANFNQEYMTVFGSDSEGFFKRSLIERATVGGGSLADPPPPAEFPSCGKVEFEVALQGNPERKYVYGVDPALQKDNFAVVIVEVWPDHRRIVHVWTTTKKDHRAKRKNGSVPMDFYRYAVRKLRSLFAIFPPAEVLIDAGSGGGGHTLVEAFSDADKLEEGERPVYPVIDYDHPQDTDFMAGDHLIRLVQFAKQAWVIDANWSLRKDIEDRVLLFPRIDEITFGLAYNSDVESGRVVLQGDTPVALQDTLENLMHECEELKTELTQIQHFPTSNGSERWDTAEGASTGTRRKGPVKKDRYSALLMANWGARRLGATTAASLFPTPVAGGSADFFLGRTPIPGAGIRPIEMLAGIPIHSYGRVVNRGR